MSNSNSNFDPITNSINKSAFNIAFDSPMSKTLQDANKFNQLYQDSALNAVRIMGDSATSLVSSMAIDLISSMAEPIQEQIKAMGLAMSEHIMSSITEAISIFNQDTIKQLSSIVDSVANLNFNLSELSSVVLPYSQYKPIVDTLEAISQGNNNNTSIDLLLGVQGAQDISDSDTVVDNNIKAIKEHKPVNIIAILGLIFSIYNTMLGTYTNLLKPSLAGEQLQIEKDQLTLMQLQYNEDIRHNAVSEEQGKEILLFASKMYNLLMNITNNNTDSGSDGE